VNASAKIVSSSALDPHLEWARPTRAPHPREPPACLPESLRRDAGSESGSGDEVHVPGVRRNSPSVADCRPMIPEELWRRVWPRILGFSQVVGTDLTLANVARAFKSSGGRRRLPTRSARNGGDVRMPRPKQYTSARRAHWSRSRCEYPSFDTSRRDVGGSMVPARGAQRKFVSTVPLDSMDERLANSLASVLLRRIDYSPIAGPDERW